MSGFPSAGSGRLRRRELVVAARRLAPWHLPDVDALLDALIAKGPDHPDHRDEKLPYWAEIWPSSLALAGALLRDPSRVGGRAVVELGCGPGLAGVAALLAGAREVVFTDWMPEALELAALNARDLAGVDAITRLVDWRAPPPDLAAEVVLAADCTYEARFFRDVYRCLRSVLRPGGQALLAEPGRAVARDFFALAADEGFRAEPLPAAPEAPGVGLWRFTALSEVG